MLIISYILLKCYRFGKIIAPIHLTTKVASVLGVSIKTIEQNIEQILKMESKHMNESQIKKEIVELVNSIQDIKILNLIMKTIVIYINKYC